MWCLVVSLLLLAVTGGSAVHSGKGTYFSSVGSPFSACGVPKAKLVDDNGKALPVVALNAIKGSRTLANTFPLPSPNVGEFSQGLNCGRWMKITLKENCVGGSNSQWSVCNGGGAHRHTPRSCLHPALSLVTALCSRHLNCALLLRYKEVSRVPLSTGHC
jgi:hypothetical protein